MLLLECHLTLLDPWAMHILYPLKDYMLPCISLPAINGRKLPLYTSERFKFEKQSKWTREWTILIHSLEKGHTAKRGSIARYARASWNASLNLDPGKKEKQLSHPNNIIFLLHWNEKTISHKSLYLPRTTGLSLNQGKLNISSCIFPSRSEGTRPTKGCNAQLSAHMKKTDLSVLTRNIVNHKNWLNW